MGSFPKETRAIRLETDSIAISQRGGRAGSTGPVEGLNLRGLVAKPLNSFDRFGH